jgi:hypothetical protein
MSVRRIKYDTNSKCMLCGNSELYAKNLCKRCYNKKRKGDPICGEICRITVLVNKHDRIKKETCCLIKKHHDEMKDDPERLTTDFIQKLISVNCDKKER